MSKFLLQIIFLFFAGTILVSGSAKAEPHESTAIPWSGYWWPFNYGGLATGLDYRGHPAPLEKYELYTLGRYPGQLVSWYKQEYYDTEVPSWWGLCLYWALAACTEPGGIMPSSEDNIIFRVGDKKGLLTLVHDSDTFVRTEGSNPEIFHQWLLDYIHDQNLPFVADLDPGEEVWSYPIYRYEMESTISGDRESVQVTINYCNDFVSPDYLGAETRTKSYEYDLFLNAQGEIIGGEWTGEKSVNDHPDKLHFSLMTAPECEYIDLEEVRRIAQAKDDFLENGDELVDFAPGTYHLTLLDRDRYRMFCQSGDTISFLVEKQSGSLEDLTVVLYDADSTEVLRTNLNTVTPLNSIMTATRPPYILDIQQADYSDPNIYTITYDLTRNFTLTIPYIPSNTMWSGYSITNPGDNEVHNVTLTTYSAAGDPVQTLLGPVTLSPGEKRLFLYEKLPWRVHERSQSQKLGLTADEPVTLINLFGPANEISAACLAPKQEAMPQFILPDTLAPLSFDTTMFGGIDNRSFDAVEVSIRVYSHHGDFIKEVSETIEPRARLSIDPNSSPFSPMPDGGWIEVIGGPDQNLCGYQYLSSSGKAESLFGLSSTYAEKIVPHVPPPEKWVTTVTIINPNDSTNQVICHLSAAGLDTSNDLVLTLGPREKRTLELQDLFGKTAGDPLYHSMLEINGQHSLAGYFSYRYPVDEAAFPLLDASNFNQKLVMPHYPPPTGKWWTGIGLCNPTASVVTVWAQPYDKNGQPMRQSLGSFTIDPDKYQVFRVQTFFGADVADDISFITFTAEEPAGMIGGFYLYGNEGNVMLTGGVM